ncbi:MAG: DNA-formamidopyrimidine glycosylase family protein [bacterium]|nr:DNA-formamidopyrimidine glycosylase family protein [bacterium]
MPELPEVETIRLGLQKYLVRTPSGGKKVESVEIRLPKIFEGDPSKIVGATVKEVRRFGKVLVLDFDNHHSLAVHVKLTGQLVYVGRDRPQGSRLSSKVGQVPNPFTHVIFHFSGGDKLFYNDIRQFGWLKVLHTPDVGKMKFIAEPKKTAGFKPTDELDSDMSFSFRGETPRFKRGENVIEEMGPEPFGSAHDKPALTLEAFRGILQNKSTAVKVLIMDQKKIGGVGNIYANDALYLAKIDPRRQARSLSEEEVEELYKALHTVLKKGLELGGASESTFVNAIGEEGSYQKHFLVYSKAGKACTKCGTRIIRTTLGGRGTFICEYCQK